MGIGPVGGASQASFPPDPLEQQAKALSQGITNFSQQIRTANPENHDDIQSFSTSIQNLHNLIS